MLECASASSSTNSPVKLQPFFEPKTTSVEKPFNSPMKFKLEPIKITEQKLKKIETRVNLEPKEESPTKNEIL